MRQSIRKFNIPTRATSWAFELLKIGLFNPPPPPLSGQKSRSNAPPISTEIPLLKDKFLLQSNTLHAFQREICRNDTFKLLLKTLLKELFTNKGEILSCKSVKPCKTRKNSRAYYITTRDNPVQIPHPSNACATFKFPPPRARSTVKCPGGGVGGG